MCSLITAATSIWRRAAFALFIGASTCFIRRGRNESALTHPEPLSHAGRCLCRRRICRSSPPGSSTPLPPSTPSPSMSTGLPCDRTAVTRRVKHVGRCTPAAARAATRIGRSDRGSWFGELERGPVAAAPVPHRLPGTVVPSAVVRLESCPDPSFSTPFPAKANRPSLRRLRRALDRIADLLTHHGAFSHSPEAFNRAPGAIAEAARDCFVLTLTVAVISGSSTGSLPLSCSRPEHQRLSHKNCPEALLVTGNSYDQ